MISIHLHAFDAIKKGEHAEAQKPVETFLELTRKRQKLNNFPTKVMRAGLLPKSMSKRD